ncbi:MAG: hypothetical protein JWN37_159 [Candidatus Nomurabacteria bacterium]|nr:hypothetical protein [Candidatus Nomurabacteria bacterium]
MNPTDRNNLRPLLGVGFLIVFILLVSLIPSRWFGIHPVRYSNPTLDLNDVSSPYQIATDINNDGALSWNEIVNETFKSGNTDVQNTPVDPKAIAELNDSNNLTASFTKNLYVSANYLKQNQITDQGSQQQVLDQLVAQEAAKIVPTIYTTDSLHVGVADDSATLKAYGNKIAPILQQLITKKVLTDDLTAINSFTQTKNETDLSSIVNNKNRVDDLLKKLLDMPVPPSALTYHLLAINRVAAYRDNLDNLSKAKSDSIRATIAMGDYQNIVTMDIRLHEVFTQYFNAKNVVFSSKDAGYEFTVGYTIK